MPKDALSRGELPDRSQLPTAVTNEGRINNIIEDVESKAANLQYTMITGPGNSGSPIVDACGDLVGLHYSGGATSAAIKFNGAVHARNVALYLKYIGIEVPVGDVHCEAPD